MAPATSRKLYVSPCAEPRLSAAEGFLRALPPRSPALILAANPGAASSVVQRALGPGAARAGWAKHTLDSLARSLATRELARCGLTPVRGVGIEALCLRAVSELARRGQLGRYQGIALRPGFVRALSQVVLELRLADLAEQDLRPHDVDLAALLAGYERELAGAQLCDRAGLFGLARQALETGHHALGMVPLLVLDVPLVHQAEAHFASALGASEAPACITVVQGDERSEAFWGAALGDRGQLERLALEETDELARLKVRLFEPNVSGPSRELLRGQVKIVSCPGESREAVEVAREILAAARRGVPFDEMAVFLRAADGYRDVVEEALQRAKIPAHFADGVRRPAPEGRAFLALLACAREGLSARSFAEYLSLGVAPRASEGEGEASATPSPRRWEHMLVEASVIGGRARWEKRLRGLSKAWQSELAQLERESPAYAASQLRIRQLDGLLQFALPILDALAALPRSATWGAWLVALEGLARLTLREPEGVCELLRELAPLGPVGPVEIEAVERLLSRRLGSMIVPAAGHGTGKVLVGAIDDAPGRAFQIVFVMGLAEKVFPPRIWEDPLLGDAQRRALGPGLMLTEERAARERLALRLAVGAARSAVVLTFPRFDVEHGRPRVPSFYGLEVLQAVDGSLPAFDELTRRAEPGAAARMGWPAPALPALAIDDAEYDLAVLDQWRIHAGERTGGGRYALLSNVHLARALRSRARRWESTRFTMADGLVLSPEAAQRLMPQSGLAARAYSATALALFAGCPYRFFLHAIMGVVEREEVAEIDELDARQRGVLFHATQFQLLSQLSSQGMLPLGAERLPEAEGLLERIFAEEVERAREQYEPALPRVFDASLAVLHADLREWLRRTSEERGWVPQKFELGFGLKPSDAGAVGEVHQDPITLDLGLRLRGAIDLVERRVTPAADGRPVLRATDHKTGMPDERLGDITGGGRVLQPVLYALALEKLFPEAHVDSGRLYFCTNKAGFVAHEVPLHDAARARAKELVRAIDGMVTQGFLPAAPVKQRGADKTECEHCSYRVVCGPYEAERVARVKAPDFARLAPLMHVRNLP